jgi:hypothetical protein
MSATLLRRRRFALALLALCWLAQQIGFAAHADMQRRMAVAGGWGEICTSAGVVRAPVDGPAEHRPAAATFCDVCAGAALGAPLAPAALAFHVPAAPAAITTPATPAPAATGSHRAHRPRAPPVLLS